MYAGSHEVAIADGVRQGRGELRLEFREIQIRDQG
jgi:hypothetical protein